MDTGKVSEILLAWAEKAVEASKNFEEEMQKFFATLPRVIEALKANGLEELPAELIQAHETENSDLLEEECDIANKYVRVHMIVNWTVEYHSRLRTNGDLKRCVKNIIGYSNHDRSNPWITSQELNAFEASLKEAGYTSR